MISNQQFEDDEEKVKLCKDYFIIGCFFLPMIWLVNTVWFYPMAFSTRKFKGKMAMRNYVILSFVGFLFWMTLLVAWIVYFHTQRLQCGIYCDQLMYLNPMGTV
ncbi:Gamma-secretase subunit pen-2 [Trichinella papuae]|uniref:Gamma-secretase subunit PEN-2 n=1 Tax=Trichinella papuae TaxID=268474 RepID=A0A0V1MI25_9BILA|nr:Gamma-secretase subunit pen-2 [Trichinella papuae]